MFSVQMSKRRRKRETEEVNEGGSEEWKAKPAKKKFPANQICILHSKDINSSSLGNFTSFNDCNTSPTEKLRSLHQTRDKRLNEPVDSKHRMQTVCELIPDSLENVNLATTGWHRGCHQRFTMNLNRLKSTAPTSASSSSTITSPVHSPRKRRSSEFMEKIIFPADQCLFCDKNAIKVKQEKHWPTESFSSWVHKDSGWQQIEPMAKDIQGIGDYGSLYRKVAGIDLFAAEAHFHRICINKFYGKHQVWAGYHKSKSEDGADLSFAAYVNAYAAVKEMVQKKIITEHHVIPLTVLREKYIEQLEKENFPNPNFRAEKLMKKMEKDDEIGQLLSFTKVELKGCVHFWLVYSSELSTSNAVAASYLAASKDKLSDTAVYLRGVILEAYKKSKEMPWPPTIEDIQRISNENIPEELSRFLHLVVSFNEPENEHCLRTKRLVFSMGQDVCRAVTQGRWKLAKHILICTTIRHLYRSKQLTTILSRLGHCETDDFGRELETAMAIALDNTSTYLTPQIVKGDDNMVLHGEWDNLNKILTNVTGSNVVNSAAGIMLQERRQGASSSTERTIPKLSRTGDRSLKVDTPNVLAPLTIYNRTGPKFPEDAVLSPPVENDAEYTARLKDILVWFICR